VIFAGSDGTDGLQIWVSDGTQAGTHQQGKIGPWAGSGAVDLGAFTEIGSDTWFWCDDGVTGKEPWRITLGGPLASVATYGTGCRGTGNLAPQIGAQGLPQLGNAAFGFGLSSAATNAFAVLNISFLPGNAYVGGNCYLYLGQPIVSLPGQLTSPVGAASAPLPIPSDPSFAGLSLNGQWLVFDPNGSLFSFATLSNALNVVMGF
jgi:ELWxxDGT repeat protein